MSLNFYKKSKFFLIFLEFFFQKVNEITFKFFEFLQKTSRPKVKINFFTTLVD